MWWFGLVVWGVWDIVILWFVGFLGFWEIEFFFSPLQRVLHRYHWSPVMAMLQSGMMVLTPLRSKRRQRVLDGQSVLVQKHPLTHQWSGQVVALWSNWTSCCTNVPPLRSILYIKQFILYIILHRFYTYSIYLKHIIYINYISYILYCFKYYIYDIL